MSQSPVSGGFCYGRRLGTATTVAGGGVGVLAPAFAIGGGRTCGPRTGNCPVLTLGRPPIVVLKSRRLMRLFDEGRLVRTCVIDLGTAPVGPELRIGDGRTSEGSFYIVSKNAASGYHRLLGIDYPDPPAASFGLVRGLISPGEAISIVDAVRGGRCSNRGSALGGGIGIHGGRFGRDWTAGCIAMSDADGEKLFDVIRAGDPVEILP